MLSTERLPLPRWDYVRVVAICRTVVLSTERLPLPCWDQVRVIVTLRNLVWGCTQLQVLQDLEWARVIRLPLCASPLRAPIPWRGASVVRVVLERGSRRVQCTDDEDDDNDDLGAVNMTNAGLCYTVWARASARTMLHWAGAC